MEMFESNGMKLPVEQREKVKKLEKEIIELWLRAQTNIKDSKETVQMDIHLLDGLNVRKL